MVAAAVDVAISLHCDELIRFRCAACVATGARGEAEDKVPTLLVRWTSAPPSLGRREKTGHSGVAAKENAPSSGACRNPFRWKIADVPTWLIILFARKQAFLQAL